MAAQPEPSNRPEGAPPKSGVYMPLIRARLIRLVDIDTDGAFSAISCKLIETDVDQPVTTYLALSYAWGDPDKTRDIICNGTSLQVTESLATAMGQLRERYSGRLFWIDAICINQQDPVERAAQVQLMRHIYQSAENVIIYLGEDCPGLDRAISLFYQLHEKAKVGRERGDIDRTTLETSVIRDIFPSPYEEVWYRFHDLFNRPWFSRIWVIQEVAMAGGNPEVICGPYTLSWSSVVSVCEFFIYTGLSGATTKKSKTSLVALMQDIKGKSRLLWDLLWLTGPFASTEPREKIFALYGLVHPGEEDMVTSELFRVDYRKPVKDVYRDVMFGYIMRYGSLCLMSDSVEVAAEERSMQGLPSWVPDWSLPVLTKHPSAGRHAGPSGFDACGGQGTLVQGSMRAVNPDLLRIGGRVVDEIAWVSEPFDGLEYSPLPWRRRPFVLQQLWEDVRERLGSDTQACHAFWRTLLADADRHGFHMTGQSYPSFLRFWHDTHVHDQNAARYRAKNSSHDQTLTEDRERELFKDYATDYGTALTNEDYRANRACVAHHGSKFLPCTSTPSSCKHCAILTAPLPTDMRITGRSPALAKRDTDPFLGDFFSALGKDHDLILCDPELDILMRVRQTLQNRTFFIAKCG
ncbi:heterokaryon incompatibility protein-domain-containing protein [Coniochaeta sp. 2T2.1]|nr:heterokaryon incompatibility protein-domain-containing protein [Coniochaeta sp. 2T2.1]